MWELDHKEGWAPKNWCFLIVMLEKTLEGPLDSKAIKPVNPKVNQPWIFIGRTDAEAETPVLWPPDAKTDSLEKSLMLGKIEGRRRRGRQRMRWLDGIMDSMHMILRTGKPGMLQSLESQNSQTGPSNWKTTARDCICFEMNWKLILSFKCIYKQHCER